MLTYYFENKVFNKKELSKKDIKKQRKRKKKKIKRKKKKVKIEFLKVFFESNIKVFFEEEKIALIALLVNVDCIIAMLIANYINARK